MNPRAPWFVRILSKICTCAAKATFCTFVCCFHDPCGLLHTNLACFVSKHLKFDSRYSNWHAKGLSCWHVFISAFHSLFRKTLSHLERIVVLRVENIESLKFHVQNKDWDLLMDNSVIYSNKYWILTHREN